jgi:hypothetical protein
VCDFNDEVLDVKLATLDKVVSRNDLMDLTSIIGDGSEESGD